MTNPTKLLNLDSVLIDVKAQQASFVSGHWEPVRDEFGNLSWPGVEFLVRGIDYAPYVQARDAELARLTLQYGSAEAVPNEIWLPILGGLLAEHLLLGWKGFVQEYSEEFAAELLPKPDAKEVRERVVRAARRVGIRELEFVTVLEKNSALPSAIN